MGDDGHVQPWGGIGERKWKGKRQRGETGGGGWSGALNRLGGTQGFGETVQTDVNPGALCIDDGKRPQMGTGGSTVDRNRHSAVNILVLEQVVVGGPESSSVVRRTGPDQSFTTLLTKTKTTTKTIMTNKTTQWDQTKA